MISYNPAQASNEQTHVTLHYRPNGCIQITMYRESEYTSQGRIGYFDQYVFAVCEDVKEAKQALKELESAGYEVFNVTGWHGVQKDWSSYL